MSTVTGKRAAGLGYQNRGKQVVDRVLAKENVTSATQVDPVDMLQKVDTMDTVDSLGDEVNVPVVPTEQNLDQADGLRKSAAELLDGMGFELKEMVQQYKGEEIGTVWGTQVKYLNAEERKRYELTVRNGKLYDAEGKPFDTSTSSTAFSENEAIFVISKDGRLYASTEPMDGYFHHSSLVAGEPVPGVGGVKANDGTLKVFSDGSGHYRPTLKQLKWTIRYLQKLGLDLSEARFAGWLAQTSSALAYWHKQYPSLLSMLEA
jgi:hypothetical protein